MKLTLLSLPEPLNIWFGVLGVCALCGVLVNRWPPYGGPARLVASGTAPLPKPHIAGPKSLRNIWFPGLGPWFGFVECPGLALGWVFSTTVISQEIEK